MIINPLNAFTIMSARNNESIGPDSTYTTYVAIPEVKNKRSDVIMFDTSHFVEPGSTLSIIV